jgi:hypothetical protein
MFLIDEIRKVAVETVVPIVLKKLSKRSKE